jgi:hypothetical protein
MSLPRRLLGVTLVLASGLLVFGASGAATVDSAASPTYSGAFEFEGLASKSTSKGCQGQGAFGVMKPGARVTLSEADASNDFTVIGKSKMGKGKVVDVEGDKVCRMTYKVKAKTTPADDSRVYLEVKGVTFNISFPASDVADGDLDTWTCEYSDNTCAVVVGR